MAKLSREDLLGAFREMTLLELSEFVKGFEDTFGVTAAVPGGPAGPPVPPVTLVEDEEPGAVDVILEKAGGRKIMVIKEVRVLTKLGLKEAKDFVEGAPQTILENVSREAAESARMALEDAGATVTLR